MRAGALPLRSGSSSRRFGSVVTAVVLLAGLLTLGAPSPATASDLAYFTDANRTVACEIATADEYTPYDKIRCDLLGAGLPVPLPPRQTDCPAEWAAVVTMDQNSNRFPRWGACVGDSIGGGPAKEVGAEVQAGVFRCTVLKEGVRCRNTETRYGFVLSHKTLKPVRPAAKAELSPAGVGKLRLGVTIKRAKKIGWTTKPVCGSPQLKPRLRMKVYLSWKKRRLTSILANAHTNVQTTKRVGVGSTLTQVRAKYRGWIVATKDLVEDRKAHVYLVRAKTGLLVFLLQTTADEVPSATTPVDAIWVTKRWNPKRGYAFDGC